MPPNVQLLGGAQIIHEGERFALPLDKRGALLAFLACADDWVVRDRLAFLFWPDTDESKARVNLRQLLRRTRNLPYAANLEVGGDRLQWPIDSDLVSFRRAAAEQNWIEAVESYRGELLGGFEVKDGGDFGAWLEEERASLQGHWQEAALRCGEELAQTDRPAEAAVLLRRIWELEAYDERVLQAYLRQAAAGGNREAAQAAYAAFEETLATEFGMAPSAESRELAEAIAGGGPLPGDPEAEASGGGAIPRQAERLVGRDRELMELTELLERPECRLLVLTGLGGVGKTRLGLELAHLRSGHYRHGVHFAPLVGLSDPELLLSALAEALAFSFYGPKDLVEQLQSYLCDKELLLVVDNLEHLIEGAGLLSDLIEAAPQLTILVTSRQQPELPHVWPYPLSGLDHTAASGGELSPAGELFLEAARRHRPASEARDAEAVNRLAELLEGLPLALELAAAWLGELSVHEISEQIQVNLDFLSQEGQGHHDSLRAVFASSWELLAPEQQRALACLAVFRGGFERAAAQGVAGASPYMLLSLVTRSLVRKGEGGRFDMHEIVRQFALEQLAGFGEADSVAAKHADHFVTTLHTKAEAMREGDWRSYDMWAPAEFGNLNAMWEWGVTNKREQLIAATARDYLAHFYFRALFKEQALLLDRALAVFTEPTLTRAVLLNRRGILLVDSGKLTEALPALEEAEALTDRSSNKLERAITLMNLGRITLHRGDYPRTQELWERCRNIFVELDNGIAISEIHGSLGLVAYFRGDFERAIELCETTIELALAAGHLYSVATAHFDLGNIHRDLGDLDLASSYFREAETTFRRFENELGVMQARLGSATVAVVRGDLKRARELLAACLTHFREVDSQLDLAQGLLALGDLERAAGDRAAAHVAYREVLAVTRANDATGLSLEALRALLSLSEPSARTVAGLLFVNDHPAATATNRVRLAVELAAFGDRLSEATMAEARQQAQTLTLEGLLEDPLSGNTSA